MSRNQFDTATADRIATFTLDLSHAAGTFDLCTATGGDIVIWGMALFCTVVGATWTSVAVQTNDTTNFVLLNATDGARANFTAGKNVPITWAQVQKCHLRSGQKIQYTMVGSTGSGTALATFMYYAIQGADLV
jgi:hypothetical protein